MEYTARIKEEALEKGRMDEKCDVVLRSYEVLGKNLDLLATVSGLTKDEVVCVLIKSKTFSTKIENNGKITIPKIILDLWNIPSGYIIDIDMNDDDKIIIKPVKRRKSPNG